MSPNTSNSTRKHQDNLLLVLATLFIYVGVVCLVLFFSRQVTVPHPAADQSSADHSRPIDTSHRAILPFSEPATLEIPSIHVWSPVIMLGKDGNGSMSVPSGSDFDKAAWYKYSPAPGQAGTSIIQGHVDYESKGPGVFFYLGNLKKGDTVTVRRKDGKTAIFTIHKVKTYQKDQFPTDEVYGATNQPSLALITCSGELDRRTGVYDSNTIAFGVLASTSP